MTLGDKLTKLRKENNYTQEQLAGLLGVSRQAVSKWESDIAYPETEKLLRLGALYNCSMDYLLKESEETISPDLNSKAVNFRLNTLHLERKSKRTFHGLPLWHVNLGFGRTAKGILAIGFLAKGIVSAGLFSVGVFSFGVVTAGLLALGAFAAGLLSVGSIAIGIIALGSISIGIVSIGALSIGSFSAGAMAIGKYIAIGDHASAAIALGDTKATGSLFQKTGSLTPEEIHTVKELLTINVPFYLVWAKNLIQLFIN